MCAPVTQVASHDLAAKDNAAMKHILFWLLNRVVLRHRFKLVILLGFVSLVLCINIIIKGEVTASFNIAARKAKQNRSDAHTANVIPSTASITLFVRMAGKLRKHRTRFYCDLLRTAVLFWPASFGKTVVVLDEESEQDHVFANNLARQIKKHFPDRKVEVAYESLPKDESVLNFASSPKPPGYNRQLWSSFFIDLYTNEPIVAWMDTDAAFITPVTQSTIFNGSKLRILGSECSSEVNSGWVESWALTTKMALGLPMVADFMTYFPVYLYRDTFTNCRDFILKRFNTRNFEEAFKKFYHSTDFLSPVVIIISYAWFFERDRYDWNLKICTNLASYNQRFPIDHKIAPQHTKSILSQPQTAYHVPYFNGTLFPNILDGYCLSHEVAGNHQAICSNRSVSVTDNLVLFNHDLHSVTPAQTPCTGSKKNDCLKVLERHFYQVALDIKNGRNIQWRDFQTVEKLANEDDIICTSEVQ